MNKQDKIEKIKLFINGIEQGYLEGFVTDEQFDHIYADIEKIASKFMVSFFGNVFGLNEDEAMEGIKRCEQILKGKTQNV